MLACIRRSLLSFYFIDLIERRFLNLSPDKQQVKLADYGIELYEAMERAQEDWEKQPIIKIQILTETKFPSVQERPFWPTAYFGKFFNKFVRNSM